MRKTLGAMLGIGAVAAVCMALLLPPGVATAQTGDPVTPTTVAPGAMIATLCGRLPDLQSSVGDGLTGSTVTLAAANGALTARRAEMTTAMTELADAVVAHLRALDGDGNSAVTGATLRSKQTQYATTVVIWSRARTQAYDLEQQLIFGELQQTMLDSVQTSACS